MASPGTPEPGTTEYAQMIDEMVASSTQASGVPYFVEDPEQIEKIVSVFAASAAEGAPAVGMPDSQSESAA